VENYKSSNNSEDHSGLTHSNIPNVDEKILSLLNKDHLRNEKNWEKMAEIFSIPRSEQNILIYDSNNNFLKKVLKGMQGAAILTQKNYNELFAIICNVHVNSNSSLPDLKKNLDSFYEKFTGLVKEKALTSQSFEILVMLQKANILSNNDELLEKYKGDENEQDMIEHYEYYGETDNANQLRKIIKNRFISEILRNNDPNNLKLPRKLKHIGQLTEENLLALKYNTPTMEDFSLKLKNILDQAQLKVNEHLSTLKNLAKSRKSALTYLPILLQVILDEGALTDKSLLCVCDILSKKIKNIEYGNSNYEISYLNLAQLIKETKIKDYLKIGYGNTDDLCGYLTSDLFNESENLSLAAFQNHLLSQSDAFIASAIYRDPSLLTQEDEGLSLIGRLAQDKRFDLITKLANIVPKTVWPALNMLLTDKTLNFDSLIAHEQLLTAENSFEKLSFMFRMLNNKAIVFCSAQNKQKSGFSSFFTPVSKPEINITNVTLLLESINNNFPKLKPKQAESINQSLITFINYIGKEKILKNKQLENLIKDIQYIIDQQYEVEMEDFSHFTK